MDGDQQDLSHAHRSLSFTSVRQGVPPALPLTGAHHGIPYETIAGRRYGSGGAPRPDTRAGRSSRGSSGCAHPSHTGGAPEAVQCAGGLRSSAAGRQLVAGGCGDLRAGYHHAHCRLRRCVPQGGLRLPIDRRKIGTCAWHADLCAEFGHRCGCQLAPFLQQGQRACWSKR